MRLIQLQTTLAFILAVSVTPCLAASAYCDRLTGPLAEKKENAGKPINEVVEALLRDAETVYSEGSRFVGRRPRTFAESYAIPDKNWLIKECHFQSAFRSASKADAEMPEQMRLTLIRIEQFDNFIFYAVNNAVGCSNKAALGLKVSRESLDHAWMEFKGDTEERDWDPKLDWRHEQLCAF